jgi:hypothetical protein
VKKREEGRSSTRKIESTKEEEKRREGGGKKGGRDEMRMGTSEFLTKCMSVMISGTGNGGRETGDGGVRTWLGR